MTLPSKEIIIEGQMFEIVSKDAMDFVRSSTYLIACLSSSPGFYAGSIVAIGRQVLNAGLSMGSKEQEEIKKFQAMIQEEKVGLIQSLLQSFLVTCGTNDEALDAFLNKIFSSTYHKKDNNIVKVTTKNVGTYFQDPLNIYNLAFQVLKYTYEGVIMRFLEQPHSENLG